MLQLLNLKVPFRRLYTPPRQGKQTRRIFRKLEHGRLCGICSSTAQEQRPRLPQPLLLSPVPLRSPRPGLWPRTAHCRPGGQPPKPDHRRPLGTRGAPPSLLGSLRSPCDTLRWRLINQFTWGSLRFITLLLLAKQQLYLPCPRLQNFS